MIEQPLVTVGVTAFNAIDTVERAIQSAFQQTWRPIEIVAVDDCSSDGTFELLQSLAGRHPEIRIYRNAENSGVAVSRNRIVEEAKGEFIAFFDDDDVSTPDRIERQYRRITDYEKRYARGAPVICHSARLLLYADGTEITARTIGEREDGPVPSGMAVAERILLGTPLEDGYGGCPTCSQMARVSTYRRVGGFDPAFRRSQDTELNVRVAKAGGHFTGIAEPLVTQTMTKTSDKSLAREYKFTLMLLDKHRDVADAHGLYAFSRRFIDVKQAWLEGRHMETVTGLAGLALMNPRATLQRVRLALPNAGLNRAFGRFHTRPTN